jgi:hypothetical protein
MKRVVGLVLTLGLALSIIAPATTLAVQTCVNRVIAYEGANLTGPYVVFCADDYPMARTIPTAGSFDSGWHFSDGSNVDNRISSISKLPGNQVGVSIEFYSGYYFAGTGNSFHVGSETSGYYNLTAVPGANNSFSSFAGCGTPDVPNTNPCQDEP